MELLQLRYFFESAKNENFAKTAEKYMVPTSSVSASVKRLEQELGVQLFDRTSNRIALNEDGKKFQQTLYTVFAELDGAVLDLSNQENDTREIKMLVRAMRSRITDHIIEYREKHPHISFKTVFDFNDADFEKYDIIIDEKTDAYEDFEGFELYDIRLRMMVNAVSPLTTRRHTLKQLSNQTFISMGEQSNMHKILINVCKRAGFFPNISVQSNDIKCFEKLVAAGMGIGLGRDQKRNPSEKIVYLDVTDFDERYTVYAYYKKQANYGNVKHFLNFLKSKSL